MKVKKSNKPEPANNQELANATNGNDITRGYIDNLPYILPTDKVLQLRGGHNYELYEDVLRDDQVKSTFTQRRMAVVSRGWSVVPGGDKRIDKQAATFIDETLKHIRWDTVTDKMLYGVFYGYAVAECLWVKDENTIKLDKLRVRNRRRFVFSPEFKLKLLTTKNPQGDELPEQKFWWFSTGSDHDDEPYGLGLAHWLYWTCWFKKNHTKFWLNSSERFADPTAVASHEESASELQKKRLLETAKKISPRAVTKEAGVLIELLEAARSSNLDYSTFYDRMNQAIAKITLSQTMTTDNGSSRSQADVHMEVRKDIVEADANLVNDSFNRSIVRWLVDWNFPGAAYPTVEREMEDAPDLEKLANRDKVLHDMGYKPTKQYIEDTYNIEVEEIKDRPENNAGNNRTDIIDDTDDFAEQELNQLEMVLDAIDGEQWQQISEPIIRPILEKATAEPELLLSDLAALYPEMQTDSLTEQLARIIFVADVWGRLNADS